jgi:ATP-binding cassette subfamily F protein uup
VALEGNGRATAYPGGWSDYAAQRGADAVEMPKKTGSSHVNLREDVKKLSEGLSFTEKKRLEALPGIMERLEAEINKLTDFLSDAEMFTREPVKFRKATEAIAERQQALAAAEEEWLALAERDA